MMCWELWLGEQMDVGAEYEEKYLVQTWREAEELVQKAMPGWGDHY